MGLNFHSKYLGMWLFINTEQNMSIVIDGTTLAFYRTGLPYPRPKTPPGETSGPPTEEEVQVRKKSFSLFPVFAWPCKLMVEIRNTFLLKKKCRSVKVLSLVSLCHILMPLLVVSLLTMSLWFPEHAFAFPPCTCTLCFINQMLNLILSDSIMY